VYAALYENGRELEPPTVSRPEPLLSAMAGQHVLFAGDGAATYRDLIAATLGDHARFTDPVMPPLAGAIAALATEAARQGHAPPPHAIRPLYVRRPDPELMAARQGPPYK
jgi:tRNA A37 threonylcarbamoyladenosine modification protein TsaB